MCSPSEKIQSACAKAGVPLSVEKATALAQYLDMLLDWNRRMDLTALSDVDDIIARHFVDSLLPLRIPGLIPEGASLIDVGSGAGFPGLPLAIARPDLSVTLLDAQNKRVGFLRAVIQSLGLRNVQALHGRAEEAAKGIPHRDAYALAVARAVAPLPLLLEYLLPFVAPGGKALCWKGPALETEWEGGLFAAETLGGKLTEPINVSAPEGDRLQLLVPCEKTAPTPSRFPRKVGVAAKRPLVP